MMTGLLLGLACETATPLPPRARDMTHVAAQMVAKRMIFRMVMAKLKLENYVKSTDAKFTEKR